MVINYQIQKKSTHIKKIILPSWNSLQYLIFFLSSTDNETSSKNAIAPYKVNNIADIRSLPTTNTNSFRKKKWNKQKLKHLEFQHEIIENICLIHVNSTVNENRSTVNMILQKGSLRGSSFRGHNTKCKSFACLFSKKLYPFYWNKYKELEKTH